MIILRVQHLGNIKIYINTPEEMEQAHKLIDRNKDTNFFRD